MKRNYALGFAFGILFLFFIQMTGVLVQSIYILDLMHTSLDEKALGLLFFFTPALLFFARRKFPSWGIGLIFCLLLISRGASPYLNTLGKMIASGVGIGSVLMLLPFLFTARIKGDEAQTGIERTASAGLGLAIALSVLLRTVNFGIDWSLTPAGGWVGGGFGLLLGWALTQLHLNQAPASQKKRLNVGAAIFGTILILTLVTLAFSAPAVIARWTGGNYALIVLAVSFFSSWAFLTMNEPGLLRRLPRWGLIALNSVFGLSLVGTILAQTVAFPTSPEAPAVLVAAPSLAQQIPLALMLLLFPVLFLDLDLFLKRIQQEDPAPADLLPGVLLGSFALVLVVFMQIFTNVWGYVDPVSTPFRNKFWLPYFLVAAALVVVVWRLARNPQGGERPAAVVRPNLVWAMLIGIIFLVTGLKVQLAQPATPADPGKTSLVVMTYNIQEGNDGFGEEAIDRQLAVIRKISPDILALQETDSTRISLNNNDVVRYFAEKLGYYSYYGPTTVTGSFGTAILSRYPLQNTRTVFTYSDTDEIGTAEAEIEVGGRRITIYDVHPDGSDTAKLVFAKQLLERSSANTDVIALGDFNSHSTDAPYQLMAGKYGNAWMSAYPNGAAPADGKNRIDHIFFSASLQARNPEYLWPPDSATDHPAHWTEIFWDR